jgi:hypothetical protein
MEGQGEEKALHVSEVLNANLSLCGNSSASPAASKMLT